LDGALVRDTDAGTPDRVRMSWRQPTLSLQFEQTGTTFAYRTSAEYAVHQAGPLALNCTIEHGQVITRPDGEASVDCTLRSAMTPSGLRLTCRLAVQWKDDEVNTRVWSSNYRPPEEDDWK
jgi:hypothetical protein